MIKRLLIAGVPLALLLAVPLALRPRAAAAPTAAAETLVIITPHSEPVRFEFERAFKDYYRKKYDRDVAIEYRSVGGTSDIVRYIADRYEAEFRRRFEQTPDTPPWSAKLAAAFSNHRLDPATAKDPEEKLARRLFLDSDVGIGIDLMWGGGTYDHSRQAERGFAVDAGVAERHPEYFDPAVIPPAFGGEKFYDPKGRYYGACLASFGICYNPDRLKELTDATPPDSWNSLGEPRFFDALVIADPTKSGSANKCFESIIQQCMAEAVVRLGEKDGVAQGWLDGFNLIKRITANARAVTDSAGKVPRDIASGNAAAGMAIDTYGLSEQQWSSTLFAGAPRIFYVPPRGGTAVSADPIQLLRGAPNERAAKAFIDFVLSVEGQKLWNFRAGTPGGPQKYSLRRPPIRRDLYAPEFRPYLTDPDYNPYLAGETFVYHPRRTGPYFSLIRVLIRCVALDLQHELRDAWQEIIAAGGPAKVPEAMREFNFIPVDYAGAAEATGLLTPSEHHSILDIVAVCRKWSEEARSHYRKAGELARKGR